MKKLINLKNAFLFCVALALFPSCNDREKDAENHENDKVGNVYNEQEQGVDIENRDNQFQQSRSDGQEGTGRETGAATDTVDNDGDKKINGVTPKNR